MFTDWPLVNTAPAMPRWLGKRIWVAWMPSPTMDHSSPVFSSFKNRVERSALSILVASPMTLRNSVPSSISEVTSATTFKNSSSLAREACIFSTNWAPERAMAACMAMASRSFRSSRLKSPSFLFSTWATPMTSPLTVRMGAQTMLRVTNPVSRSTSWLKCLFL